MADSGANARLQLLYELGCAFAARLELAELLPMVAAETRRVLDASGVSVLLHDAARNELYFPYVAQDDAQASRRLLALRMPSDRGIAGTVVRTGKAGRIDDITADPRFYAEVDRETGVSTRTMLCTPLRARSGVLGIISVVNRRKGPFTDDDLAKSKLTGPLHRCLITYDNDSKVEAMNGNFHSVFKIAKCDQ